MHATGCRCLDHWHTTDGLTQRKIAALDLSCTGAHRTRKKSSAWNIRQPHQDQFPSFASVRHDR
jgi:hypothetical protein